MTASGKSVAAAKLLADLPFSILKKPFRMSSVPAYGPQTPSGISIRLDFYPTRIRSVREVR